ncbi:MAG: hypothetical protein IJ773_09370 [Lachnospiraceae bacterium]|nr:hypothetical protein [Lachnospiraceae bacterium]
MKFLKGKSAGSHVLFAATVLSLVACVAYSVFGLSAHVFNTTIFGILCVMTLVGLLSSLYTGVFTDYLPAIATALGAAGLITLGKDSVNDLTAFFVGMGDYFGNADNVGPRVLVFALILLASVVTFVGAFLGSRKKA